MIDITPPYDLKLDELVLDPAAVDVVDLARELRWLSTEVERAGEHEAELGNPDTGSEVEVERILRGAVCLKAAMPAATMAQCLRTAIIWERG